MSRDVEGLSRSEQVYARLLSQILQGELPPGTLLREVPIAQALGVSRTPVHEALRRLVHDGLVIRESDRRLSVARANPDEVRDLFEIRKILEVEATRRATPALDRPTLEKLQREAARLCTNQSLVSLRRLWPVHDENLHAAIAGACGSRRLREDIHRYRLWHRALNGLLMDRPLLHQAASEHAEILGAMADRRAEAAATAMHRHLNEWQAIFVRQLDPKGS